MILSFYKLYLSQDTILTTESQVSYAQ